MQVDSGRIIQETLARLSKLNDGEGLLLQPYKKDRSVLVIQSAYTCWVIERGFVRKEYEVEMKKIRKLLKKVFKNEFQRSNKVWLKQCSTEEVKKLRG